MQSGPASPAEQLRLALLDLQRANLDFARTYGRPEAETAAKLADDARQQASRWAALVKATDRLEG